MHTPKARPTKLPRGPAMADRSRRRRTSRSELARSNHWTNIAVAAALTADTQEDKMNEASIPASSKALNAATGAALIAGGAGPGTSAKALEVNLDPATYGSFAEI